MKYILLAILIITGVKIVGECALFPYAYACMKPVSAEDESKNEKEENKNGKRPYEEIFHNVIKEHFLYNSSTTFSSLNHQEIYPRLSKKPNTPPPDFI
jgi:hypothetical protein